MIRKRQILHRTRKNGKKFELNNKSILLNILYIPHNTEEMKHAYMSKYNTIRENQVFLLMITDGNKWHYLAVKILPALLRGVTSKHVGNFYCLNFFTHIVQKKKSIIMYFKIIIIVM